MGFHRYINGTRISKGWARSYTDSHKYIFYSLQLALIAMVRDILCSRRPSIHVIILIRVTIARGRDCCDRRSIMNGMTRLQVFVVILAHFHCFSRRSTTKFAIQVKHSWSELKLRKSTLSQTYENVQHNLSPWNGKMLRTGKSYWETLLQRISQ